MNWFRSSVMAGAVLVLATAAQANEQDLNDCKQSSNLDLTIRGCSRLIDQATGRDWKLAAAYANRGTAYLGKGDLDRAIIDYTQAINLNPKIAFAYNNRGVAFSKKGDLDRAVTDYTQAITLNPKDALAYNNRGISYSSKSNFDLAQRLGADGGIGDPIDKPKGLRWATFDRKMD